MDEKPPSQYLLVSSIFVPELCDIYNCEPFSEPREEKAKQSPAPEIAASPASGGLLAMTPEHGWGTPRIPAAFRYTITPNLFGTSHPT